MPDKKKLSEDEMIKNLARDYPVDLLDYIKPEVIVEYGRPTKFNFEIQEIKKHSHYDRKLINDIPIVYEFENKKKVVLTLIEHWSDKDEFEICRFAHYVIDLYFRFPDYEILPIALFTDQKKWRTQPQKEIIVQCLGEVYLKFTYKLVSLKADQAEKYKNTKNKFIAVMRSAMDWDRSDKVLVAIEFIKLYNVIEPDIKTKIRNQPIIDYFLNVSETEKDKILDILEEKKDTIMITEALIEKGEMKEKLKTAKKLLEEEKMTLESVLRITELTKEDLEKEGII